MTQTARPADPPVPPYRTRVVAFDVDATGLTCLREAFPEWEIEAVNGATAASLAAGWDPGRADLLVVDLRGDMTASLGLCQFLTFCNPYSDDARQAAEQALPPGRDRPGPVRRGQAPLLVLVRPGQQPVVAAALEAGADHCLVLPIVPNELTTLWARLRPGNQPGRHALDLDRPHGEDPWRDAGGQG